MTAPRKAPALSERQVTEQVIGWLKTKGWKCIRLQSGVMRGLTRGTYVTLGEKDKPDWICLRKHRYLLLEIKATGKRLSFGQTRWFQEALRLELEIAWTNDFESFVKRAMAECWD